MDLTPSGMLETSHAVNRLYDRMRKPICVELSLTTMEFDIIAFLYNNPEKDTASDIISYKHFSKGNVSHAIDTLSQGGYLEEVKDSEDRRRIHLKLKAKALGQTEKIAAFQISFYEALIEGFSDTEKDALLSFLFHVRKNANEALAKGK